MTDQEFNLFNECAARCVNLSPQEEESTPSTKHLKGFRIISSEMQISLFILK